MAVVSAWAGIESGSNEPRTVAARGAIDPTGATAGANGTAPTPRRMRRQQRPIIGSLDAAGAVVQRNMREIVVGSAWILVPSVALNLIATTLAFDRFRTFRGSSISVPELFGGRKAASSVEDLLWYLGLVVTSLTACLVGGYVATLVVRRQLGLPMRIRNGYRAMLPRLPALLVAWLIGHAWFPFVALILAKADSDILPVLIVFGGPVVLVLATMTVCAAPAIVVERLGPIAGLRRAWRLGKANFSVLFGFVVGSVAIGVLVQYGIAYLPRLLQGTQLVTFGRFGWLIEGVAGQLGRLMSTPLIAVATVLVYLEVRMTTEGMDLTLDADRAFGART